VLAEVADPKFAPFVSQEVPVEAYSTFVHDELGGLVLRQSGYVDTRAMLTAWQAHLQAEGRFTQANFAEEDLQLLDNQVIWRDIQAKQVVYCRGHHDRQSKFWTQLPYRPVKGEVLWVQFQGPEFASIINRGCWVVPSRWPDTHDQVLEKSGQGYKVGATYEWKTLDTLPSPKARAELEAKLGELIRLPYTVVAQEAGIRPATADRKPFVGRHPSHPQVAIFGGLGAKGISLAPFFAEQFYQFCEHGQPLDKDVDIGRYFAGAGRP
jgi:glycine/D-amino acid oxidase-like deaminating enzyme